MRKVTWDAEAGCELNCSTLFYSRRGGEELGNRFLNTVDQLVESIQRAPDSFKSVFGEVRKARLPRFPYYLIYPEFRSSRCLRGAEAWLLKAFRSAAAASSTMPPEEREALSGQCSSLSGASNFGVWVYWLDVDTDSIHILALAHTSREPGYWKDRL